MSERLDRPLLEKALAGFYETERSYWPKLREFGPASINAAPG